VPLRPKPYQTPDAFLKSAMVSSFSVANGVLNPIVRSLLRSPLRSLVDGSLMAIYYTGRRSGRGFSLVTMYARSGDQLIVVVGEAEKKKWWRNFRERTPATVLVRGEKLACDGQILRDDPRKVQSFAAYCAKHPGAASLSGLKRGKDGTFNSEEMAKAARDAVMVVFDLPPGNSAAASSTSDPAQLLAAS